MKKHTRPVKCKADPPCDYRTDLNKTIARHYWAKHLTWAEENYKRVPFPDYREVCKVCKTRFSRRDNLTRHLANSPTCKEKLGI